VVVTNQHLPRLLRTAHAALDQLAIRLDASLRAGPTECIGAGVDRIGQQPVDRTVAGQPPFHYSALWTVNGHRCLDALFAQQRGRRRAPRLRSGPDPRR
jgi:hypothetical protein